ncbi:MAG: hypothetical protein ACP5OP_07785 [Leptospirillia bacterium]
MTRADPPGEGLMGVSGEGAETYLYRTTLALIDTTSVVAFVSCDNRFDADFLMQEGHRQGLSPSFILSRIRIARMFTLHQLASSVRSRLKDLLARESVSGLMISGIVPLFSEKRIPRREAERLLEETLGSLKTLARRYHLPCLLLLPGSPEPSLTTSPIQRQAEAACTRILHITVSPETLRQGAIHGTNSSHIHRTGRRPFS